ncbi:MAG: DUF4288 domain-containing protein [Candidatus Angelobacter sp.]
MTHWPGKDFGQVLDMTERKNMANPPTDPRWYIAELTEEVALAGGVRPSVVHRKTRVIFADSPEDAYEKALSMSTEHEPAYLNQNHQGAQIRYWGLSELNLVDEKPTAKPPSAHYRKSDGLTPLQIAILMSMVPIKPGALPN